MLSWLVRFVREHQAAGLVPVDGDFGRHHESPRKADDSEHRMHASRPARLEEAEWIPSAILYGPPW